ncbi:KxYKxGKxW signal peptide domain-containing protein [Limosilactobacillus reuteri]
MELKKHFKLYKSGKIGRTIPFRVDTLNNKSANSRGCFSFLVIPQQKN